jgi:hypothetical protein
LLICSSNFKLSDLKPGSNYATIQTAGDSENAGNNSIPCCVVGELFPYGFYTETRYRIITNPDADHTFGVLVTTDGSSGLAYCSYRDGMQVGGNTGIVNNPDQYTEKKYPIIFVGISCYWPGQVSTSCLNVPIAKWYDRSNQFNSLKCSPSRPLGLESEDLAVSTNG